MGSSNTHTEEEMNKQKSFCFFKGELVDCIPGRVQDCNVKQVRKCVIDEEKEVEKKIHDTNGFCFCKGELVSCHRGTIQDCNTKQLHKCPKE